ncbi:MAG: ATP-dependent DNA helicase [Kiritimatiellia bacterium]|jgi:ATP-dependent DNA helicase DinG
MSAPSPTPGEEFFEELFRLAFPASTAETIHEMTAELSAGGKPLLAPPAGTDEPRAQLLERACACLARRFQDWPGWALSTVLAIHRELGDTRVAGLLEDVCASMDPEAGAKAPHGDWADTFAPDGPWPPKRRQLAPADCTPIDPDAVAAMLDSGGALAESIPGYEPRKAQLDMAKAVAEAFNSGRHLLVEAGTGTGKSLAYLLPAALWSSLNDAAVVVSTNTRNLQTQLVEKDLPRVRRVVNALAKAQGRERTLRTALLKGRSNYLCLRRLEALLDHGIGGMDRPRLRQFARAISWAVSTPDGDLDALVGSAAFDASMAADLCSSGEECHGRSCRHARRCFAQKARNRAQAADVVVANHALVFADMGHPGSILPAYAQVVFDEAHNLEEAATSHFSTELSRFRLRLLLRGIVPMRRRPGGVLETLRKHVDKRTLAWSDEEARSLRRSLRLLREHGEALLANARNLFDPLAEVLRGSQEQVRFGDAVGTDFAADPWPRILSAADELKKDLAQIAGELLALATSLQAGRDSELPLLQGEAGELEGIASMIEEFISDVTSVLAAADPQRVFWVQKSRGRTAEAEAWSAPLEVGEALAEALYKPKASVVFCSATLRMANSFSFLAGRLGLGHIEDERLLACVSPSPFDYMKQCSVMVPAFLPEPVGPDVSGYTEQLAGLLRDLAIRTHGRMLGLFTSIEMMRRCGRLLAGPLRDDGIRLLVQGESGSRDQITRIFRAGGSCVLLGTHSFWEGVDVSGDALSCVVMARLPFPALGDPLVEARCEQLDAMGRNSFASLMLPSAVIRFRQGFGRLIRHRNDRGIVVVADSRIATKGYGGWFRRSLPCPVASIPDREGLLARVEDFFGAGGGAGTSG